jgi:CRP/FNR family transcriptional regulator
MDTSTTPLRPQLLDTKHTCGVCDIRNLLPNIANGKQVPPELSKEIKCKGPFLPGDIIYKSGDPLTTIYAVTSGSVKTETVNYEGFIQATGFFLRGEVFGYEALGENQHVYDAYAIERTWLCELSIAALNKVCMQNPPSLTHLFKLMSQHNRTHLSLTSICGRTADQRMFDFLSNLAGRLQRQKCLSNNEQVLPMTKEDIANYLGITPETVSRSLRRLDKAGLISYKGKMFSILSTEEAIHSL